MKPPPPSGKRLDAPWDDTAQKAARHRKLRRKGRHINNPAHKHLHPEKVRAGIQRKFHGSSIIEITSSDD